MNDVPITIGNLAPINNWIMVPIPAINNAPSMEYTAKFEPNKPNTEKTIMIGVILAANIAKTC